MVSTTRNLEHPAPPPGAPVLTGLQGDAIIGPTRAWPHCGRALPQKTRKPGVVGAGPSFPAVAPIACLGPQPPDSCQSHHPTTRSRFFFPPQTTSVHEPRSFRPLPPPSRNRRRGWLRRQIPLRFVFFFLPDLSRPVRGPAPPPNGDLPTQLLTGPHIRNVSRPSARWKGTSSTSVEICRGPGASRALGGQRHGAGATVEGAGELARGHAAASGIHHWSVFVAMAGFQEGPRSLPFPDNTDSAKKSCRTCARRPSEVAKPGVKRPKMDYPSCRMHRTRSSTTNEFHEFPDGQRSPIGHRPALWRGTRRAGRRQLSCDGTHSTPMATHPGVFPPKTVPRPCPMRSCAAAVNSPAWPRSPTISTCAEPVREPDSEHGRGRGARIPYFTRVGDKIPPAAGARTGEIITTRQFVRTARRKGFQPAWWGHGARQLPPCPAKKGGRRTGGLIKRPLIR